MTVRTDNFARGNGGLGANWTDWSWGATGAQILAGVATGTGNPDANGDFWNADAIGADQFSLLTVAAVPSAGEWVGVTVRQSGTGGNGYLAIWFQGSFMLFNENGTSSPALITSVAGTLAVGDSLCIGASGTTITVYHNGTQVISVTDATYASGAPGIAFDGTSGAASLWMGGDGATAPLAGFSSADGNGIQTWYAVSALNLPGPNVLRIKPPVSPAAGIAPSFLFGLPVSTGTDATFGDPFTVIDTNLGALDTYNATLVVPSFPIQPWYANSATLPGQQQEAFMLALATWIAGSQFASGGEKKRIISFSKGGIGGQGLIFHHPEVWDACASWDAPFEMTDYDGTDATFGSTVGGDPQDAYGTSANFTANYELSSAHLAAWRDASDFATRQRLWVGGWFSFQADVAAYKAALATAGILADTSWNTVDASHAWHDGWVAAALASIMTTAAPGTGLLAVAGIV